MKKKKVILSDVAEAAGVSIATASRSLNGDSAIAEETARLVIATARKINYRRKRYIRSKRFPSQRKIDTSVAFISLNRTDAFSRLVSNLTNGALEYFEENGTALISAIIPETLTLPENILKKWPAGLLLDGKIIDLMNDQLMKKLRQFPIVSMLCRRIPNIDIVLPDNVYIGRMAATTLLSQGCKDLVFVTNDSNTEESAIRYTAFNITAQSNGATVHTCSVQSDEPCQQNKTVETGFFLENDDPSLINGFLKQDINFVHKRNIVACVKFAPDLLSRQLSGWTYLDLPVHQIGKTAAELLTRRIQNPKAENLTVSIKPSVIAS